MGRQHCPNGFDSGMSLETGGRETASQRSSVLEVPGVQGARPKLLDHVPPHAQAISPRGRRGRTLWWRRGAGCDMAVL
jgi:hypothetical protein